MPTVTHDDLKAAQATLPGGPPGRDHGGDNQGTNDVH